MIRLTHPLALLVLVAVAAFLFLGRRRLREHLLPALAGGLVALALAGPELGLERPWETISFLVDRSPSVTATVPSEETSDEELSIAQANPDRRLGAEVSFASTAAVTILPSGGSVSADRPYLGEKTDLSAAVLLGLATLPEGGAGQLVLLSDGRITDGLDEAIGAAVLAGVPISTVAVGERAEGDAALVRLDLPSEAEVGRPFAVTALVAADAAALATLALYRNGELLWTRPISLVPGITSLTATEALPSAGAHTYRLFVKRPGDPLPQNDGLSALVASPDRPELLLLSSDGAPAVASLLSKIGRPFASSAVLPPLEELATYHEVMLSGVRLGDLTQGDVETLRTFVADLGGGLVVAEGEKDLRGVAARQIEEILPVSYTMPQKGREASLCVLYVLDHSGSMRGSAAGATKIDVLKEAAAASLGQLAPQALVGVIAFNRDFERLIPIQPLGDGAALYERLRSLDAAGGTDIYYPLVDALDLLEGVEARVKHILLFSDGKTVDEYRDFPSLVERLRGGDVRLTAIAVGPSANLPLLNTLAEAGHGTVYPATDFAALPRISIEATQRLSRSRFTHAITPVRGPFATGDLAELPPLHGYVLTYSKPTAETLLFAGDDPILSRWRIGLGQVTVLNTDLAGEDSSEWLSWSKAPLLVDAILSTAEPTQAASLGLAPSVEVRSEAIVARVDARDARGDFASFLDLEATLLPDGETRPLEPTGPGWYEASFALPGEGGYALKVVDTTRDRTAVLPFTVPYLAEYRATGVDEEMLRRIAAATGGRYLTDEILPRPDPERLAVRYLDLHSHLLLAALSAFLLDLALRKVPWKPGRGPRRGA